jgi:glycosyltransferase involved in cell wall biosynthesis
LPDIAVVVCTRNRPRLLEGCLAALAVQSYSDYEVLVVDNAPSDDLTKELCERWDVRRVVEPRGGLDWARNRGIEESGSSVIAFTDDDARPDPGWLAALARAFAAPDVDAVNGLVVPDELETVAQQLFEDEYGGMGKGFVPRLYRRRGHPMTYAVNRYGTGCNMAFRRSVLERLGGFDTALDAGTATGGGGDLDMFQRVIESGAALVYRPDVVVRHVHRQTVQELRRQLFDNGRAYSAAVWACVRRARRRDRVFVLIQFARWLRWWIAPRLARSLLRRQEARMPARLILVELAGGMLGPLLYRRARRRARKLAAKE